ncbi:MAG TPA: anthranilate synthase component I family protein [Thermodesulfovibrionales bacterium]|nr:anthranilate synthase component I family protein [Thermodesulfovibrionales bacterium]
MISAKCTALLAKRPFVDLCGNSSGSIPPLASEIPYASPHVLYPLFSGSGSFLFESVKGPENIARYSFIGFDPYMVFRVKDGSVEIQSDSLKMASDGKPLKKLGELLGSYPQLPLAYLPPFQGGAVGLLSYDFVHYFEKLPHTTADDLRIPDAQFYMIDRLVAFDHVEKKAWAILCPGARSSKRDDPGLVYDEAEHILNGILMKVKSALPDGPPGNAGACGSRPEIGITYGMSKTQYMDMVVRAKEYIAAGDIFQINLSQRLSAYVGSTSPWGLYERLRSINPSPFAGFMDFGDYSIVSSSPERLVRVKEGLIETRPIAGTRPRGSDRNEDERMRRDLLLNEKERAEHIMLIDLERNDLGRVSDYGSVKVDELMITEDYSHVIHIVSNVKGSLREGRTSLDVIRAVFPGGTITGVPKVRCMEIIDELEPVSRGPYTGSMGYIGFSGNMDMNIIIRSFVIKDGYAYVQAGAGIVADSDPEREYYETLKKAEALIKTLEGLSYREIKAII